MPTGFQGCCSFGIFVALLLANQPFENALAAEEALPEYRAALAALEKRFGEFSARAQHQRIDYQSDVDYYVKGDSFQSITQYDDDVRPPGYPKRWVRSASPSAVFEVISVSMKDPYSLRFVGEEFRKTDLSYESKRSMPFVLAATHLFGLSMRTIVDSPDTKVESARAIAPVNAGEVQGDYEVVFLLNPARCKFDRAEVTFARAAGWVVTRYCCYFDLENAAAEEWAIYQGAAEYSQSQELGGVVPKKVTFEVPVFSRSTTREAAKAGAGTLRETAGESAEILEYRPGPISDRQFTLPQFGLPEFSLENSGQPGLPRGRTTFILTLCGFVVLAVVVVLFLRTVMVARRSLALLAGLFVLASPLALLALRGDGIAMDDLNLGSVPPQKELKVQLTIRNRSFRSVSILGGESYCGPTGCNDLAEGLPCTISGFASGTIPMKYRAPIRSGPFRHRIRIYTNTPGQPYVDSYVHGDAL